MNGVLTIPNGVEIIADECLRSNDYIKVVNCPSTLKKIGNNAFNYSSLEMINFNEGLLEIGDCAFYDTKIRMSYLPDSLEYLGDSAFEDCNLLQEVKFGHHLKNIPNSCFRKTAISYIKLEEGIESIGNCAFESLYNLRKIDFCSSLKKIGENAFSNSSRTLVELNFNEGLIEIGNNAFSNGYVENLYLPDSLKYIGEDVPMEKLKEVSCANIEILDLFFKSQSRKYFDKVSCANNEIPDSFFKNKLYNKYFDEEMKNQLCKYLAKEMNQNVSTFAFSLNIKSLSELSNGVYGDYYFEFKNDYISITSFINNKNKDKQSKTTVMHNNNEYDAWSNNLKKMEVRLKKLDMQKQRLQSIPQNIGNFLLNFGKWFSEPLISATLEINYTNSIQETNDEVKTLTDELFDNSKQEENIYELPAKEEISLQIGQSNEMVAGVSSNEDYDYIDNNNRMWRNGDMITFNEQQQIQQKPVSLVKKKEQNNKL